MKSPLGELVKFSSSNGFQLDGILYSVPRSSKTIVHVHGSLGNFYHNGFLKDMAACYQEAEWNFLSFNLSAHDGIAEGYRNEVFQYVGGSILPFDTCIGDIQGAVDFVHRFSNKVILQGHSLGCDRVLNYLVEKSLNYDCILLSPCDSRRLHQRFIHPETIDEQIVRITALKESDEIVLLPSREYGIGETEDSYSIPVTRQVLLSILSGPIFKLLNINKQAEYFIDCNCFVYIGGMDPLQVAPHKKMFSFLENRISNLETFFCPTGDHDLSDCEDEVITAIVRWIKSH